MQVITDIIRYLSQRGLLSPEELRYLAQRGFAEEETDDDGPTLPHLPAEDEAHSDPLDHLVEQAERKLQPHRRAIRRGKPPAPTIESAEVAAAILAQWPSWEAKLGGLLGFACLLEPVADLRTAIRVLRHASTEALDAAVASLLRGGKPSLKELWIALTFANYGHGVVAARERGPAVLSYRAIAAGTTLADLGRFARDLRYAGYAHLYLLTQGQRAVLRAFGRMLAKDAVLFDRRLFTYRGYDAICYWSLVYAFSALLPEMATRPPIDLHPPRELLPEPRVERAAWANATRMAGPAVTRLLARYDSLLELLYCPAAWDAGRYRPA
jgi:hypothetical protein